MRTMEDPLGLIQQMYPSYWPESKRQEVRGWSRMRQIVEVLKYKKYGDVYKALTKEEIEEFMSERDLGVQQVGDHWWRISSGGGRYFYTDRRGMEEFDRLVKERMGQK